VGAFQNFNMRIVFFMAEMIQWMVVLLSDILTMSPQDFSPGAYAVSQAVGIGLAPFAVYIMVILWGVDFLGSVLSFSDKPLESIIRLVFMLAMGIMFTHISFFLVMGLFDVFGGIVAGMADLTTDFNFGEMLSHITSLIDDMNNTSNMVLFVFMAFSLLSFFGMFLGMILVPVAIFVELYIYAAFSPIPIATLFTGQKQVGIAFIKLVISVCLRGSLVLFGINIALHIMSSGLFIVPDTALGEGSFAWTGGILRFFIPIMTISISLMILQKCIKGAEQFAKSITGANAG